MSNVKTKESNTLADLAARIREGHEEVVSSMQQSLEHAMDTGEALLEAKSQVKHGEWQAWLWEHCDIPERTASRYMRLAKNRSVLESELAICNELSVNAAIRLLAPPKKADEDTNEESADKNEVLRLYTKAHQEEMEALRLDIINDSQEAVSLAPHDCPGLMNKVTEEVLENVEKAADAWTGARDYLRGLA
jgi:hypothetical protein